MRAFVWDGGRHTAVRDVPHPEPAAGWARVDVAYAGICGTDLHIVAGEHPRAKPGLVLGHEVVGRLTEDAHGLPAGCPVFVNPLLNCGHCRPCRTGRGHICEQLGLVGIDAAGGVSEQLSVPETALVRLPADVDLRVAALIEPVAVGVRAVRQGAVRLGDRVHVVGAGPIGLVVAACARLAGARQVTVTEPNPGRAATAESLGFALVPNGVPDRHGDVVFDCTGHPSVSATVTAWVATAGRLVVTGVYPGVAGVDLQDVLFRELTLVGTRVYDQADVDTAVDLVTSGRLDVAPLVTAVVPLEDAPQAVDRLRSGTELKVLVRGPAA